MGNNINTVIFDLDGTLINSEPAALGATIGALSRFGVSASDTEVREQFGAPETILNTENESIKGAAKIMTQPATMAYPRAITIFGLGLWFHMAAPDSSSAQDPNNHPETPHGASSH